MDFIPVNFNILLLWLKGKLLLFNCFFKNFIPNAKFSSTELTKYWFFKDNDEMPSLVPNSPEEQVLLQNGEMKSDEHIKGILSFWFLACYM